MQELLEFAHLSHVDLQTGLFFLSFPGLCRFAWFFRFDQPKIRMGALLEPCAPGAGATAFAARYRLLAKERSSERRCKCEFANAPRPPNEHGVRQAVPAHQQAIEVSTVPR